MNKHLYLAVSLLVLNLVLCMGLIYTSRKLNRFVQNNSLAVARVDDLERQKREQWYNNLNINEDTILSELCNLGFGEYVASPLIRLAIFIPPGFCGACLDSVCESITDLGKEISYPIVFIVPSFKYRDIHAHFSAFPSVISVEYNYELLSEGGIVNTDSIFLFRMGNEKVGSIVFTDKEFPEWIRDYLIK